MTAIDLQALRIRGAGRHPYLAAALWSMVLVEKPGLGTMAIDRFWRLYIDPEIGKIWNLDEQCEYWYTRYNT